MSYLLVGSSGISEVRLFTGLSDTTVITDAEISEYIDFAEAELFVRLGTRYYLNNITEKLDGTGTDTIYLTKFPVIDVCYVIMDGVTLASTAYMSYPEINIIRLEDYATFTSDYQNIEVCYDYGIVEIFDPYHYKIAKKLALYLTSRDVFTSVSAKGVQDTTGAIVQEKLGDYTLNYDRGGKYSGRMKELDGRVEELYSMLGVNIIARIF